MIVTAGGVLWFPFGQPILLAYLSEEGLDSIPLILVSLFGVSHLLQSAALLAIYFVLLWTFLRWNAGRKVERLFARWREPESAPSETNLYAAAGAWLYGLLEPVRNYRERLDRLKKEYEELVELSGEDKVV